MKKIKNDFIKIKDKIIDIKIKNGKIVDALFEGKSIVNRYEVFDLWNDYEDYELKTKKIKEKNIEKIEPNSNDIEKFIVTLKNGKKINIHAKYITFSVSGLFVHAKISRNRKKLMIEITHQNEATVLASDESFVDFGYVEESEKYVVRLKENDVIDVTETEEN